jgi:D-glycero-beta-D-manno-heptose 1-phosphate adenylyltransferase
MRKAINKIISFADMAARAEQLRLAGKTIVFTNGCFDILHAGHVSYLAAAADLGDVLVVGLNSDGSVKTIKGDKRPVIREDQRACVVAALYMVDYVVLFDTPDPLSLICGIRPDILVKGADWPEHAIVGADFVKAGGGRVARIDLEPGISTTTIIERIGTLYYGATP